MKDYKIQITETLQRIITILADSEEAAIVDVEEQYRKEGIVLDSNDIVGSAEFEVIE